MARRKSTAALRAEIKRRDDEARAARQRMLDELKELERKEKAEAKRAEEKLVMKLGRLVLDLHRGGFVGFEQGHFVTQVNEMAGQILCTEPEVQSGDTQNEARLVEEPEDVEADTDEIGDGGEVASGTEESEAAGASPSLADHDASNKSRFGWG